MSPEGWGAVTAVAVALISSGVSLRVSLMNRPKVNAEAHAANATLQAGYLLLAARALGLDAGPMAGFDKAQVDAAFFAGTDWRTNFLINLGHGDASKLKGRLR